MTTEVRRLLNTRLRALNTKFCSQVVQVLEGPRSAVADMYETISKDDRHGTIVVQTTSFTYPSWPNPNPNPMQCEPVREITKREFSRWSMELCSLCGLASPQVQTLAPRSSPKVPGPQDPTSTQVEVNAGLNEQQTQEIEQDIQCGSPRRSHFDLRAEYSSEALAFALYLSTLQSTKASEDSF